MPVDNGDDTRAWRQYVHIPVQPPADIVITQGDCTTTYNTITTLGIKDAGLQKWLDGEIQSFVDSVVKDTSPINKTWKEFHEKGLDQVYPGSTFIRRVVVQAYSSGGVFSLMATDYTVFRPTDSDIQKNGLSWGDGNDGVHYVYEWGFTRYNQADRSTHFAEAYEYRIRTKCLNLIDRKPMQLSDLLRGEEGLKALNLAISRQITDLQLEDNEVLARPFTGISPDYPCFAITNYGPGSGSIVIGFNAGNPWFNLDAPDPWCTYRQISIFTGGQGALLNAIWYDDRLASAMGPSAAPDEYGMKQGQKYLVDFGQAIYEITNGQKTVRIAQMADKGVMGRINAGINEFEAKYLDRTYITSILFFPEAQEDKERIAIRANVQEMGNILQIIYYIDLNMRQASLSLLFDLATGKRLGYRDLLKKDYFDSMDYKGIQSKIKEDVTSMNAYGGVYLYYAADVDEQDRKWTPRYTGIQCSESWFDWDRWGKLAK